MPWKPCILLATLFAASCGPDPYAWIAVTSVSPDHVTVRYTENASRDILAAVTTLAEAQCGDLGRRAVFQWDIELISEDQSRVGVASPGQDLTRVRLRKLGFHQVHFLCVEP